MVQLPVLTELKVEDYELFPGSPPGSGIAWPFAQGVTVIAGINGLGKTTLLPDDSEVTCRALRSDRRRGGRSLSVVLPKRPVRLKASHLRIFGRRVSDGAENARVELSAKIGENAVTIRRRLDNLSLERLTIDEQLVELPGAADSRETIFQSRMTELIGLGSFVDVLLVLHHVVLFYENRPGALWDTNAQRHLLRALCLDQNDARRVVELERELQTADSQARNVHARITATERRRDQALRQEAGAEGVRAELAAEQRVLDAELQDAARLGQALQQIDDERKRVRLAYERAKIVREEADGAVERLKYTALLKRFPSMDDTTRLALSRIMAEGRCMVCGSPAPERQQELEQQVARGHCPICGAEPEVQENVVLQHEFDKAKLTRERERAVQVKREEEAQSAALERSATRYRETLSEWRKVDESMRSRKEKNKQLRAHLPQTVTSRDYEHQLQILRSEHDEWQASRASRLEELRALFADRQEVITVGSEELMRAFSELIKGLLVDEVRLVQETAHPRYLESPGQPEERVEVPAYAAEMTGAARQALTRRGDPSDVSESQRELIDLAFRLALLTVFGGSTTFAMETPEASLDGITMERVGRTLAGFASRNGNRLVVTNNLTNTNIVTAMFEATEPRAEVETRNGRVLDLLKLAAPNRALTQDRERYEALLERAVAGPGQ